MCQRCAHRLLTHLAAALTASAANLPDETPESAKQHLGDVARIFTLFVPPERGDPKPDAFAIADFFTDIGAARTADIDNALAFLHELVDFMSTSAAAAINAMAEAGDQDARHLIRQQQSQSSLMEMLRRAGVSVEVISAADLLSGKHPNTGKGASGLPDLH